MVDADQIIALTDELKVKHSPLKVVLFGSYAYGTPTEDSDVDLLVLTRSRKSCHQQFVEVRQTIDVDFSTGFGRPPGERSFEANSMERFFSAGNYEERNRAACFRRRGNGSKKAEGDYDVVLLLVRSRKPSRFDPICFHAQAMRGKIFKSAADGIESSLSQDTRFERDPAHCDKVRAVLDYVFATAEDIDRLGSIAPLSWNLCKFA